MSTGKYRFMVPAHKAVSTSGFASALFEMIVMSTGGNREINLRRIRNTISCQDIRYGDFGRREGFEGTFYVVGTDNQYVKIERDGFEYGSAVLRGGYVRLVPTVYKDISETDHREYENAFLNRISQPAVTKDIGQVTEHFSRMLRRERGRDSLSFGYTPDEKNTCFGEKMLISSVTEAVMRKVRHDDIMNISGKELHKIGYVTSEMGSVLNGLIQGEIPRGYDRADFAEIVSKISEFAGGTFSPVYYREAAERMETLNLTDERGKLEIDRNFTHYIEELRKERKEKEERSSEGREERNETERKGRSER